MEVLARKNGVVTGQLKHGQNKMRRVMMLVIVLKNGRYTHRELMKILECSSKSVYRYLNLLESLKFEIESDFNKKYFITGDCPICGNTTNNHLHGK